METGTFYGAQTAAPAPQAAVTVRYCLYARKSSEAEERQALSIDSQVNEMLALAQREGLTITDMYRESHSAKDCGQRPVFNQLLNGVRSGKFDGILVWHPDRLSRNAGDLGAIVDLFDQKRLIEIRTISQRFTNNPNEKFLLMILGSQAKLENDNKSINVKRGLKTRVEMGLWPSVAPTGYLNHPDRTMKCHVIVDPLRSHVIRMMFEKAAFEKQSIRRLFKWLKEDMRFLTRTGKPLTVSNVQHILRNSFYTGLIEYPKASGKWYHGRHEPIVTQELFKRVQERLDANRGGDKTRKEFAFTRLIKCGMCKSGVTAEEKFKGLKDGTTARYIYYGCTRFNDKECKNTYLREEELINQLVDMVHKMELNLSSVREKLEKELGRFNRFRHGVLGLNEEESESQSKADLHSYAEYLLREGTVEEKRDFMSSFKSSLILLNKRIILQ